MLWVRGVWVLAFRNPFFFGNYTISANKLVNVTAKTIQHLGVTTVLRFVFLAFPTQLLSA
jgi:hypothetical protein